MLNNSGELQELRNKKNGVEGITLKSFMRLWSFDSEFKDKKIALIKNGGIKFTVDRVLQSII